MKTKSVTIWLVAIAAVLVMLGPLAQKSRGSFVLTGNQELTVNSYHYQGTLYDTSRASIVSGGRVDYLRAYNSSSVDISGGTVYYDLRAYNSSSVDMSGGSVGGLVAYDSSNVNMSGGSVGGGTAAYSSSVNISGGSVYSLVTQHSSSVDISGGTVGDLYAYDSSAVDISGGSVSFLGAYESSTVDISGGSVSNLAAYDSSTVNIHGQNFSASGGSLVLDGERVLGKGNLYGEWMDGTPWVTNIGYNNYPEATILVIPEPATLLLLGLGATLIASKRRRQ